MYRTWIICATLITSVACGGDANTNDFQPADNPLRRGSEGFDDEEVRQLRLSGRPATIEEAERATTGLLMRIDNALQWPRGARNVATVVHLNVRLCGSQHEKSRKGETRQDMVNCHELRGTVNQNDQETFYMTAGEAFAVIKDSDQGYKATLQYKLTSQASAIWHSGGQVELSSELDRGKQSVDVRVVEARQLSFGDEVHSTFAPRNATNVL